MKKFFGSLVLLAAFSSLTASEFILDKAHTNVGFSVKHMMVSTAKGSFKNFDAMMDFDEASKTFRVFNASVEVASVDTNNAKRDEHIKDSDFLNNKANPKLTFVMSKYEKLSDTEGKMYGTLNINGISKEVVFNTTVNGVAKIKDKTKLGFELETKILRKDFKVATSTSDNMISNEVKIEISVEADKKN